LSYASSALANIKSGEKFVKMNWNVKRG